VTGADQRPTPNEKKTGARYQRSLMRRVEKKGIKRFVLAGKVLPLDHRLRMGDRYVYVLTPMSMFRRGKREGIFSRRSGNELSELAFTPGYQPIRF